MEILREEIMEAQKIRAELNKWKLVIVSALAAIGLGLTDLPSVPYAELVLCGIPFACAYVDLLHYHQGLIISVVGEFMRSNVANRSGETNADLVNYEQYSWKMRELRDERGRKIDVFALERYAVSWSSIFLSMAIALYALIRSTQPTSIAIALCGLIGTTIIIWVRRSYQVRRNALRSFAEKSTKE